MDRKFKRLLVLLGIIIITVLHFDFWWFDRINPLLFGFIPFAMWFQALIGGVVASIFLFFAYKVIWPDIPDNFEDEI